MSCKQQARQFIETPPLRLREACQSAADGAELMCVLSIEPMASQKKGKNFGLSEIEIEIGSLTEGRQTYLP
jgi:hypothetical protein